MATPSQLRPAARDMPRSTRQTRLVSLLLVLCLAFMIARLLFFSVQFARLSLQMDFSAYYTAGKAINRGLDPYVNQVRADPPLWDGVARYTHSRFLYPPLAAYVFSPLAHLPYSAAKAIWTGLGIVTTAASLLTVAWIIGFERITSRGWMVVGIVAAGFHPLLTHLERGQIDTVTLLILVISIGLMMLGRPRHAIAGALAGARGDAKEGRARRLIAYAGAGLLLALATLLKLHVGLILPFLVVRKRWFVATGYGVGLVLIVVASLLVAPDLSRAYVTEHLSRISTFGEGGTEAMLLPQSQLDALLVGVPEGMTAVGDPGHREIYQREAFSFFANGTFVRFVMPVLQRHGLDVSLSQLSLGLFALFFGAFFLWQLASRRFWRVGEWRFARADASSRQRPLLQRMAPPTMDFSNSALRTGEYLYWALALVVIAAIAPQTWVMNLVWLLPLLVVLAAEAPHLVEEGGPSWAMVVPLLFWAAGLVLAALPDRFIAAPYVPFLRHIPDRWLYPWGRTWASDKYLAAETLLLLSVAAYVALVLVRRAGVRGPLNATGSRSAVSRDVPDQV